MLKKYGFFLLLVAIIMFLVYLVCLELAPDPDELLPQSSGPTYQLPAELMRTTKAPHNSVGAFFLGAKATKMPRPAGRGARGYFLH